MLLDALKYVKRIAVLSMCFVSLAHAANDCPPPLQPPTPEQIKAAQPQARDRGLLWSVTKAGHTSYLFGTMHVGNLEWSLPGPKFIDAIKNTNKLALELNLSDPAVIAELQGVPKPGLAKVTVSSEQQVRLEKLLRENCAPEESMAALRNAHPVMQIANLSLVLARKLGLEAAYASEFVLLGAAMQLKREVIGLETPASQFEALIGADDAQAQKFFDETLSDYEKNGEKMQSLLKRLTNDWAQNDFADLEKFDDWCECRNTEAERAMMSRMIDRRNPLMAERIDALHKKGEKLLVGVGVGHMVGALGLPKLLKARGYEVQQLVPAP